MASNYLIKKGNHKSSGINFGLSLFKSEFNYVAKFTKSCIYSFKNEDKFDINKLCGVSTSYNHHNQSARFGWRSNGAGGIQLFAYWYDCGERKSEAIMHLDIEEEVHLKIQCLDDKFVFYADTLFENRFCVAKINKKPSFLKYNLFPYFGGNRKSPQEITINLIKY